MKRKLSGAVRRSRIKSLIEQIAPALSGKIFELCIDREVMRGRTTVLNTRSMRIDATPSD